MSSELNHWYLDATVYRDQVEEVYYVSDPARNVRRRRQTWVWKVEQFLGHGSFEQVRLERNHEDGQVRAVKRITTTSATLSNSECEKELKALLEFSKPKFKEAAVFVEFFGWFKDGYDIFLAMEYVYLGDLHKNVVANSGKIPENKARDTKDPVKSLDNLGFPYYEPGQISLYFRHLSSPNHEYYQPLLI